MGAGIIEFSFTMNPNLKYFFFWVVGGWVGRGGGAGVSELFLL